MKKINLYFLFGSLCILLAFVLFSNNLYKDYKLSQTTNTIKEKLEKIDNMDAPLRDIYLTYPQRQMPEAEIDGNSYIGFLKIPKLNLDLPILDTWSDYKLRIAPSRFKGSIYQNNMIIMAHNYMAHFGKIHLLDIGDELAFEDIDKNVFRYKVIKKETLQENELKKLLAIKSDLTLFTCNLSGEYRIVIGCEKL